MKQRFILLTVIIGLVVLMCQVSIVNAKTKKLKVWIQTQHYYEPWQEVVQEFEKDYGYKVEVEFLGAWANARIKIMSNFAAGTPPDVMEVRPSWTAEFGIRGFAKDLTEEISQWPAAKDFFEKALEEPKYGEKFYGIKAFGTAEMMFYNKSIFRGAGLDSENPPTTWDETLKVAKALTRDLNGDGVLDQYGWGIAPKKWAQTASFMSWLAASGTPFFNEERTLVNLDTQQAIALGRFLQDLKSVSYVAESSAPADAMRKRFATGEDIGMISGITVDVGNIRRVNPDLDYGISYMPVPEGQDYCTSLHGPHFIIPADAENPEAGWELLKRFENVEKLVEITKQYGMTFPRKSWAQNPEVQKLPMMQKLSSILETASSYFGLQLIKELGMPSVTGKIGKELIYDLYEKIIYQNEDPTQAFKEFTEEANKLIQEERGR